MSVIRASQSWPWPRNECFVACMTCEWGQRRRKRAKGHKGCLLIEKRKPKVVFLGPESKVKCRGEDVGLAINPQIRLALWGHVYKRALPTQTTGFKGRKKDEFTTNNSYLNLVLSLARSRCYFLLPLRQIGWFKRLEILFFFWFRDFQGEKLHN